MMIQYQDTFPFLKENFPENRMLCLHNYVIINHELIHGKF